MEFRQGRDNLACTIYVPWDCNNNCEFCPSKKLYSECKRYSFTKMSMMFDEINSSPIQDIVITGGEPAYDISKLKIMIKSFPLKNVFINTTFPHDKALSFIKLVNESSNVKGVNISRHSPLFKYEVLNGIAEDLYLGYFKCPIHINVFEPDIYLLSEIIYRYSEIQKLRKYCGFGPLTICIREDFRKTDPKILHTPNDKFFAFVDEKNYEMVKHTECNVCDTTTFKVDDGFFISYHKGLEYTSIENDNSTEVNDIVVFPDGKICYDWDRDKECGIEIFDTMKFTIKKFEVPRPVPFPQYIMPPCGCDIDVNHEYKGCGSGGC